MLRGFIISVVLVVCWFATAVAVVVWWQPETADSTARPILGLRSGDPALGKKVPLPVKDITGRKIIATAPTFEIYAGSCTICSLRHLNFAALPYPQYAQVVVLFESEPRDIPKKLLKVNKKLFIVSDPAGRISDALCAGWGGRWYEYKGGQMVNFQHNPNDDKLLVPGTCAK